MQTLTYSQYCKNKDTKQSLSFMNGLYIYEGKLYSPQQIDAMFPTHYPLVDANNRTLLKGENKNKKENYINGGKSY